MKQYNAKDILNFALAGHSGSGKTSLAEAMLFLAGASDRLGKVSDGNTVCDYDAEDVYKRQEGVFIRQEAGSSKRSCICTIARRATLA